MQGAVCGLIGAIILGPRIGRFEKTDDQTTEDEFKPHNVGMVTLGALILWFGWYGFNGGSAMNKTGLSLQDSYLIQKVCMNTTLSGSAGSLTVYFLT